jgi:hypothetical protein
MMFGLALYIYHFNQEGWLIFTYFVYFLIVPFFSSFAALTFLLLKTGI